MESKLFHISKRDPSRRIDRSSVYNGTGTWRLTHCGLVTSFACQISGSKRNCLLPDYRTSLELLSVGPLGTTFCEIWTEVQWFSFQKLYFELSSAKWWPTFVRPWWFDKQRYSAFMGHGGFLCWSHVSQAARPSLGQRPIQCISVNVIGLRTQNFHTCIRVPSNMLKYPLKPDEKSPFGNDFIYYCLVVTDLNV